MTLLDVLRRNRVAWTTPTTSQWVATGDDQFLGMVERNQLGFRVTNHAGTYIGFTLGLDEAKTMLENRQLIAVVSRKPLWAK